MAFARRLRQDQKKECAKTLDLDAEQGSESRSPEATAVTNADLHSLKEDVASTEGTGISQPSAIGGALSYKERIRLAIAVGRCQHQQRLDARREVIEQRCRERQEQREEQRREREAQKEREKEEAERIRKAEQEAEAVRREEEALRELARRQRAAKIALEIKLVREERARQEKLQMQEQREERIRQRELAKERAAEEKRRAEDFRLLITMLDPNDVVKDAPRPPPRKRRRAPSALKRRSKVNDEAAANGQKATLAICDGDATASEELQDARWERTGLEALYASDDDFSSNHSNCSSSDLSPERSKLQIQAANDSIVECETLQQSSGAVERDLGLRQRACTRVFEALQEASSTATSATGPPSESSAESRLWIVPVPHTNNLSLAASVLEEEANYVARSGYRTRIRGLVSALRRAPHAGAQARELLTHLTGGDLAAARQFASLRSDALLTPAEQESRRLANQEALRAAIVRPEHEGLPLVVRPEVTCPACGVEGPRLQLVGFCREMECSLHGTHGGVGPQRYRASCEACLHSWFHNDDD